MDTKDRVYNETDVMTLGEIAKYLKLSEKTIHRMLRKQEIPSARVGGQWRFLRSVIDDWLLARMQVLPRNDISHLLKQDGDPVPISRLIKKELIKVDITGNTKQEILAGLIKPLVECGMLKNRDYFLDKLLEREFMSSTAIGGGIAMPHFRRPEENIIKEPLVVIGISRAGLDFAAHDGQPTHLFFLIISDSDVVHLKVMSRLSAILKESTFVTDLRQAATALDFLGRFIEQEKQYLRWQDDYK